MIFWSFPRPVKTRKTQSYPCRPVSCIKSDLIELKHLNCLAKPKQFIAKHCSDSYLCFFPEGEDHLIIESRIQKKLSDAFQPVHLEVINESFRHSVPVGSETHFLIVVVSKDFENLSRIHRQRKVHEVLSEELSTGVHALSQRLMTPAEWQVNGRNVFPSPNCEGQKKG